MSEPYICDYSNVNMLTDRITTNNIKSTTVDSAMTIGNNLTTGSISMGNPAGTGLITMNRPITPGYTVQPTSTQIGYQIDGSFLTGTTQVGTTAVTVSNITLPSTGVWNITFVIQYISLGQTQMVAKLTLPAPESTSYNYPAPLQSGSTFYFHTTGSYTGYFTGSTVTTLHLDGGDGTQFSGYYGKFRAIRIA